MAQNAGYYQVHVTGIDDSIGIPDIRVEVKKNGITLHSTYTDYDGQAYFQAEVAKDSNQVVVFKDSGIEEVQIEAAVLSAGKVYELKVKVKPIWLDQVEVITYKIPLSDWKSSRETTVVEKKAIRYTAKDLKAFEQLKGEGWDLTDSVSIASRAQYLQKEYFDKNLYYPPIARDYGLQEKVYACLTLNQQGKVVNLKLRGKYPVLVLAAARAIVHMPAFKMEGTPRKKTEMIIPINFKIQG